MTKLKGNKFEDYQYQYLERLIKWYSGKNWKGIQKIKVEWLSGLMKQQFYDDHQKRMLNKMVEQYNSRSRKDTF
tara:strand:- start:348 stop:569 length:222 start_codon:yes stop_codon:yes gene_type:complete